MAVGGEESRASELTDYDALKLPCLSQGRQRPWRDALVAIAIQSAGASNDSDAVVEGGKHRIAEEDFGDIF